jgi:hypothetical protein
MPRLEILDSLSDPGDPAKENEDRIGWNATAAFVIDGATGLGAPVIAPPRSDAAWIAEFAKAQFETALVADRSIEDVVRDLNAAARERFFAAAGTDAVERYRYPNAAFQCLRAIPAGIETAGLADCTLLLRDAGNTLLRRSGSRSTRGNEQQSARNAIARSGGFNAAGESYSEASALADLRTMRGNLNTAERGIWTLGVEPAAGQHVVAETLAATLPAVAILCTDGFADLVDNYGACTAEELIARAERDGLALLLTELRRIEREIDPDGAKFPRYKRSDDASAILIRLKA